MAITDHLSNTVERIKDGVVSVSDRVTGTIRRMVDRDTSDPERSPTGSSSPRVQGDDREASGGAGADADRLILEAERAQERARRLVEQGADEADDAGRQARRLAEDARETAEQLADRARGRASDATERARALAAAAASSRQRVDRAHALGEVREGRPGGEHASTDPCPDQGTVLARLTRDELYQLAQRFDITGRSSMNKDELIAAIAEHRGATS